MVPAATAVQRPPYGPPPPPPRVSKRHQLLTSSRHTQAQRTILQYHRLIAIERHHLLYKRCHWVDRWQPGKYGGSRGGNIITIPSSAESDGNSTSVSCFIINKSNFLAYQWGTLDYQEEVVVRPEFKGTEYRTCTITPTRKFESYHAYTILVLSSRNLNCHIKYLPFHSFETKGIPYYPPWKRWLKMCISISLTIRFTVVTLLGTLILYGNRDAMLANYFASGDHYIFLLSFSADADAVGKTAPIMSVVLNRDHLHNPFFGWLLLVFLQCSEDRTYLIINVFAFRFVW